jgi:ribosomal protein S17E
MLAAEVPSPLKGLLRNFNPILTKTQQDNLPRIITGMLAYEGKKYVNRISGACRRIRDRCLEPCADGSKTEPWKN